MVKVGILVIVKVLEEWLSVFPNLYDTSYGSVVDGVYYLEVCSFCTQFIEYFNHKGMLNFINFSSSIEIIIQLLSFILLIYHID